MPSKKNEGLVPIGFRINSKDYKRIILVGNSKSWRAEAVTHFISEWSYNAALPQMTLVYDYEHFESRNLINAEALSRLPSIIAVEDINNLPEILRNDSYKINCGDIPVDNELVARIDKFSLREFVLKTVVYFP